MSEPARPLGRFTPASCPDGAHLAFTTTDREGVWFWVCRLCPWTREQSVRLWET